MYMDTTEQNTHLLKHYLNFAFTEMKAMRMPNTKSFVKIDEFNELYRKCYIDRHYAYAENDFDCVSNQEQYDVVVTRVYEEMERIKQVSYSITITQYDLGYCRYLVKGKSGVFTHELQSYSRMMDV